MKRTEHVPSPGRRSRRKPYRSPRITKYGHVKDIVKGSQQVGNDSGANRSKNCWIAEALYGVDAPRTLLVRGWLNEVSSTTWRWRLFSTAYTLTGRPVARSIRRGLLARAPFLWLFDDLLARAVAWSTRRATKQAFPRS